MSQIVCFSVYSIYIFLALYFLHGVKLTDLGMLTCNSFCRGWIRY